MLQEANQESQWYHYGFGMEFVGPWQAIAKLRSDCRESKTSLINRKIIIDDVRQVVALAPQ